MIVRARTLVRKIANPRKRLNLAGCELALRIRLIRFSRLFAPPKYVAAKHLCRRGEPAVESFAIEIIAVA